MSRTMTMEPAAGTINPHTGHMEMPMHPDEVALHRAIGPDQADPHQTEDVEVHQEYHSDGRVVDHQDKAQEEDHSAEDHQEGRTTWWWRTARGTPIPMPQAPQPGGHHGDKLVGNPPVIFTGDRSKAEQFITQWQLYEGVNITNTLMRNPYQRAMFFLTYIQGALVNEWVKGVNAWLRTQVVTQGWATTDERLWNGVIGAFNRQYADVLEQEKAQAELGSEDSACNQET
jgi:hypothetical protein